MVSMVCMTLSFILSSERWLCFKVALAFDSDAEMMLGVLGWQFDGVTYIPDLQLTCATNCLQLEHRAYKSYSGEMNVS